MCLSHCCCCCCCCCCCHSCCALQIALAGNCVYEQTRQKTKKTAPSPSQKTDSDSLPPSHLVSNALCHNLLTLPLATHTHTHALAFIFMPSTKREFDQLQVNAIIKCIIILNSLYWNASECMQHNVAHTHTSSIKVQLTLPQTDRNL